MSPRPARIEPLEVRALLALAALDAPPLDPASLIAEQGLSADGPPADASFQSLNRAVARIPAGSGLAEGTLQLAGIEVSRIDAFGERVTSFVPPSTAAPAVEVATAASLAPGEGGAQTAIGAPDIVINPGPTLAGNQPALDAFNRAAEQWEALLSDPITVTIDADLVNLGDPNVIGQASSVILVGGYDTIRNQLVADADADDGLLNSLPTAAQFSATLPAGFGLDGNASSTKASLKAAGFAGLDTQFGPTDATIEFNTQFAFDFDNSDGVTAGTMDFETVAAHEIGHALGFVSIVDTVDFLVDGGSTANVGPRSFDLFRFLDNGPGADPGTSTEFTTFPRELSPAVNAVFDDLSDEWRVSTGAFTGDGRQASHWKDNNLTGQLIGIMDPTLAFGQTIAITDADLRALDLIGWDIVFSSGNQPPVLDPIPDEIVNEGTLVTFTATASDPDPGDQLTFSLGPGAPSGATIDPNTGLFQWLADDDVGSPFVVTVIVTDDGSPPANDQQDVQITVNNVAPTASLSGPATAVPGQPRTFVLSASDPSPVDQASSFTFDIDWDGDSVVDEQIVGPSGTQAVHVFETTGTFTPMVTATDKDGATGPTAGTSIDVVHATLQPDEQNPALTNLAFGGTAGLDAVFFLPGFGGTVTLFTAVLGNVFVSDVDVFAGVDGRVIAYGLGGSDIFASEFLSLPAEFHGDNGNDVLAGGLLGDVIDGGAGNDMFFGTTATSDGGDTLIGGDGRDFFYANLGADSIDGGSGEDLLIAGDVLFNNGSVLEGLTAIRNEWLSSRDYATRVANISGTGTGPRLNGDFFLLPDETVFSDAQSDQLTGGADLDWFVYGFLLDTVSDPEAGEVQTDTDP